MTSITTEQHNFSAEISKVLHLMIHSLYTNKDIFLRELISNASDACDKLRYAAITDSTLHNDALPLQITLSVNKPLKTIAIADNGIGMNRTEVVDNIGTIASSGTRRFLATLSGDQAKDSRLIGQFGVGFYSAFIIADKITLTTRRAGQGTGHGVRWESDGKGEYTLETVEKSMRGTDVVLHLREDQQEFLDPHRLRNIVVKYFTIY